MLSDNQPLSMLPQPVPSEHSLAQLRQSARTVTATLIRDEQQIPDPWDLLQSSYSRDYLPAGAAAENQLRIRQVHVIPDILLAQFEGQECKCFMGLLPVLGRAWLSVDHRLYLWEYATGRDFTCFDELDQTIIDVALVRPREGIFIPLIRHLLVVVTAAELVLLGVSFAGEGVESDLIVHRTGLSFPSDDINMLSVVGSRTGRIFAGGQDGNLYEFVYQAEEGWFTRKCRKLNKTASPLAPFAPTFLRLSHGASPIIALAIDRDRHLLYALGDDSSVQLFSLGKHERSLEKLAQVGDLFEQASRLCPAGLLNRKAFKIVSIHVVELHDSAFIHLLAISSCGIKLYFTTLRRDERAFSRTQLLAGAAATSTATLELVHVRLPAEEGRNRDARRLIHSWNPNIHTTFYSRGLTLVASAISKQEDMLVATIFNQSIVSTASIAARSQALESITDVAVEGKIWDIQEESVAGGGVGAGTVKATAYSSVYAESITPALPPPRTLLVLSNAGVFVLQKTGPIADLHRILVEANGNCEGEALRNFVQTYTAEQTCFFLIVLACSASAPQSSSWLPNSTVHSSAAAGGRDSSNLAMWAVSALISCGGEPRTVESGPGAGGEFVGAQGTYGHPSYPVASNRLEFAFSALHQSLYIYFARLVAPFWSETMERVCSSGDATDRMMALHAFYQFLERNGSLANRSISRSSSGAGAAATTSATTSPEDAMRAENESILHLKHLAKAAMELLAFISICSDYHVLGQRSAEESLGQQYGKVDCEELISTARGREVVAEMGAALVQRQLKMKASVDSLCQVLLQRCPSFFGGGEVVVYHGTESLERAKQARNVVERKANLDESLKYFLAGNASASASATASPPLTLPVITEISRQYQRLAYFPGVVELCLAAAASHDPENVALYAMKNPGVALSTAQQECVNLRDSLYQIIFETLRAVHGVESRAVAVVLGPIDVEQLQRDTLLRALKSRDEAFHLRLYDWLVENKLGSLLLDADTPFLLAFLQLRFAERSDVCKDLLWKYLARKGQFLAAAKILDQLASSPEFALSLDERIERLSLALGNAKSESRVNSVETAEYIQDLEERLEVARLQHRVLEQVLGQYGEVAEVAELNGSLCDITKLFNQYARPLRLWECALLILHCASYQDPLLVHQFWTNVIEKTLEGSKRRFDLLAQKIAELAKRLYPSPYAFPTNFVLDSLLVTAIKNEQGAEWIAATFAHTVIPARELLEQMVEFLQGQATFWAKPENREYLISAFVALAERSNCPSSDLKRPVAAINSLCPSNRFTGRLNQLLSK